MRAFHTLRKLAGDSAQYVFDFNPWLQSIGSNSTGFVIDIGILPSKQFTSRTNVVSVNVDGGKGGDSHRIGVTCIAANGLKRQSILEVAVYGVNPAAAVCGALDGYKISQLITTYLGSTLWQGGGGLTGYSDGYSYDYAEGDPIGVQSDSSYADNYADNYA